VRAAQQDGDVPRPCQWVLRAGGGELWWPPMARQVEAGEAFNGGAIEDGIEGDDE
jgi:hypothetical protein